MKILMSSRLFCPSIGGSQTNAEILAHEFTRLGHLVKIITQTPGTNLALDGSEFPFEVIRQPNLFRLIQLVKNCDVYFHNGMSLRDAWPLLIFRKPWVIRHHVWIRCMDGTMTGIGGNASCWSARLKQFILKFAVSISISQALAAHLQHPSIVIPNPYREHLFRLLPEISRTKELVFLGRLVSEKGVEMLLEALVLLRDDGFKPRLTIIGTGEEESKLRQKAIDLGITEQVAFVGVKVGEELVKLLNEHQIMVIPSIYNEPFGVVALEGIACGCVIVGSEGGGLKDAIGLCGVTFPNGNVNALKNQLFQLLANQDKLYIYRQPCASHLSRHNKKIVAKAYLEVLEKAIQNKGWERGKP